jgi:hypothetical protein
MTNRNTDCIDRPHGMGIDREDCWASSRIAMTPRRWHELERGDGNDHGSWTVARGKKPARYGQHAGGHGAHNQFVHDDNGKPFLEYHSNSSNYATYSAIPDRERGARKRLKAIMARYPGFTAYAQGDPRGAAPYVLKPGDIPAGSEIDSRYNRGVAVYK